MPISSNRRQRVIEFATPKVADLVIVERVDSSKNVNAAATAYDSDYGTPHPDATRFPNFKLALIKNSDDDHGQYQDWYYVADRTEQDKYNWEFQAAGGESPRCPLPRTIRLGRVIFPLRGQMLVTSCLRRSRFDPVTIFWIPYSSSSKGFTLSGYP